MGNELYIRKNSDTERVMIIDDQPNMRAAIADQVTDANFIPIIQNERIDSLQNFIKKIQNEATAAIFDYCLSQQNYATFNGVQAIKELYMLCFPALLTTSYFNADISEIQVYRQYIPIIIKPKEINPETIVKGFSLYRNEFAGLFSPERKPWRSLIRVEKINDDKSVDIVIPSWDSSEKVRFPISIFPVKDKTILGMRFFAKVNIGSENNADLYCYDIEIAEKPVGRYAKFLHS